MKIDHIAIWVKNLEKMKDFYMKYFGMTSGEMYRNQAKRFSSFFLSFENGARLELMHREEFPETTRSQYPVPGLAHFSISAGSREAVDKLTEQLRSDGYVITGEPRITGDGYYDSTFLDPENNLVEITE